MKNTSSGRGTEAKTVANPPERPRPLLARLARRRWHRHAWVLDYRGGWVQDCRCGRSRRV